MLIREATISNKRTRTSMINNKRNRIIQMISSIWIRYNRRSKRSPQHRWAWLSSRKRLRRESRTYSKSTERSRRIRSRSWPFNTNKTLLLRVRRVSKTLMLTCLMTVVAAMVKRKRKKGTKSNSRIRVSLVLRNSKIKGSIRRPAKSSSSKRSRVLWIRVHSKIQLLLKPKPSEASHNTI